MPSGYIPGYDKFMQSVSPDAINASAFPGFTSTSPRLPTGFTPGVMPFLPFGTQMPTGPRAQRGPIDVSPQVGGGGIGPIDNGTEIDPGQTTTMPVTQTNGGSSHFGSVMLPKSYPQGGGGVMTLKNGGMVPLTQMFDDGGEVIPALRSPIDPETLMAQALARIGRTSTGLRRNSSRGKSGGGGVKVRPWKDPHAAEDEANAKEWARQQENAQKAAQKAANSRPYDKGDLQRFLDGDIQNLTWVDGKGNFYEINRNEAAMYDDAYTGEPGAPRQRGGDEYSMGGSDTLMGGMGSDALIGGMGSDDLGSGFTDFTKEDGFGNFNYAEDPGYDFRGSGDIGNYSEDPGYDFSGGEGYADGGLIGGFSDGPVTRDPVGSDDYTVDPFDLVREAISYGRRSMGLPSDFQTGEYDDDDPSFEYGGEVEEEGPEGVLPTGGMGGAPALDNGPVINPGASAGPSPAGRRSPDPRSTLGYLTGQGALAPDIVSALEQQVDPDGQMPMSMRAMEALKAAPTPDARFGYLQSKRQKYNAYSGAARAAADHGDAAQAAAYATQAFGQVPGNENVQFAPAGQGRIAVHVRGGPSPRRSQVKGYDDGGYVGSESTDELIGGDGPVVLRPDELMFPPYDLLLKADERPSSLPERGRLERGVAPRGIIDDTESPREPASFDWSRLKPSNILRALGAGDPVVPEPDPERSKLLDRIREGGVIELPTETVTATKTVDTGDTREAARGVVDLAAREPVGVVLPEHPEPRMHVYGANIVERPRSIDLPASRPGRAEVYDEQTGKPLDWISAAESRRRGSELANWISDATNLQAINLARLKAIEHGKDMGPVIRTPRFNPIGDRGGAYIESGDYWGGRGVRPQGVPDLQRRSDTGVITGSESRTAVGGGGDDLTAPVRDLDREYGFSGSAGRLPAMRPEEPAATSGSNPPAWVRELPGREPRGVVSVYGRDKVDVDVSPGYRPGTQIEGDDVFNRAARRVEQLYPGRPDLQQKALEGGLSVADRLAADAARTDAVSRRHQEIADAKMDLEKVKAVLRSVPEERRTALTTYGRAYSSEIAAGRTPEQARINATRAVQEGRMALPENETIRRLEDAFREDEAPARAPLRAGDERQFTDPTDGKRYIGRWVIRPDGSRGWQKLRPAS